MNRRVVVTGLGVISSIGIGHEKFWKNLIKGKSGISKIELFDTSRFKRHYGGEVKNFNPDDFIPKKMARFFGRASQFAIAATKLALEDSKISLDILKKTDNLSVCIGTTLPEDRWIDHVSESIIDDKSESIKPTHVLNVSPPSIVQNLFRFFNFDGMGTLIPNACAAGNYAIAYGFDNIKNGHTDLAIAGGVEALSRIAFQGFQRLYTMSTKKCSPFDKNRGGMLLGEGAGILILESMERALKRKAHIYGEVLGYGASSDAHHMTIPNKNGIMKAMQKALRNAGLSTGQIDYISAHGTGTSANDKSESSAIIELFGNRRVPVSSIKSMLGHCMGAASAIEAITCCLVMKNKIIPPTINYKTSDPECNIDCVPNKARKVKSSVVLNNGFAFGGNNCCVVFKRVLK